MPQQVDNQNDKRLLRYILALSANFIIFIFVAVRHKIFPVRLTCAPQLLRPGRGQLRRAEYCDDHACVCVRLSVLKHISETTSPNFTKLFRAVCGRGSVHLWRRCDTLHTSGLRMASCSPGIGDAIKPYTKTDSPGAASDLGGV